MDTYVANTDWLTGFSIAETDWKPVMQCDACLKKITHGEFATDCDLEEGIDLEQIFRWCYEHAMHFCERPEWKAAAGAGTAGCAGRIREQDRSDAVWALVEETTV